MRRTEEAARALGTMHGARLVVVSRGDQAIGVALPAKAVEVLYAVELLGRGRPRIICRIVQQLQYHAIRPRLESGAAMDVRDPIVSVIPSLDGVVLQALAGSTAPMNLSSVHGLAGRGSLSGVRRVLLRLVRAGLVLEAPGGYVLNREHVAAGPVATLAQLWVAVFDRIRRDVARWATPPRLVGVFGSAARRDGDETSDIDLLVISDGVGVSERAVKLAEQVERWTGNPVRVVTLGTEDVRRMRGAREPILAEWERDLVVLVGNVDALEAAS